MNIAADNLPMVGDIIWIPAKGTELAKGHSAPAFVVTTMNNAQHWIGPGNFENVRRSPPDMDAGAILRAAAKILKTYGHPSLAEANEVIAQDLEDNGITLQDLEDAGNPDAPKTPAQTIIALKAEIARLKSGAPQGDRCHSEEEALRMFGIEQKTHGGTISIHIR